MWRTDDAIKEFEPAWQDQVVEHILEIQNQEFELSLTLDDQPDLKDIAENYQHTGGNFWIAFENDRIIGTIGLFNLGNGFGDLRKMFVKSNYRGKEYDSGKKLLDTLLNWARIYKYKQIFLETTSRFAAAQRFYQKNNFIEITADQLPSNFPVIKVAEKFMVFSL